MNGDAGGVNWAEFRIGMMMRLKEAQRLDSEEARLQEELAKIALQKKGRITLAGGAVSPVAAEPLELRWPEIKIELSEDGIRYRTPRKSRYIDASMVELGLNDGRKRKRNNPSDLWVLLGELAVSEGVLNWGNADKRKKVLSAPKQVERLGKKLKAFFGISQPPFDHYKKRHEYRSRFAISLDSNYRRHLESRAEVKDEPMFKEEYRDDRGQALDPDE